MNPILHMQVVTKTHLSQTHPNKYVSCLFNIGNSLEVQQRKEAENRAWHANLIVVAARYKLYSLDWTKRQKSAKRIKVQHICWDSWPNDQKGYK